MKQQHEHNTLIMDHLARTKKKKRKRLSKVSEEGGASATPPLLCSATDTGESETPPPKVPAGASQPLHDFPVDESDHCETPLQAYQDVASLLDFIAKSLGRKRSTLKIYDPYFCDGAVLSKLGSLGFSSVTNENNDFYRAIEEDQIPTHDCLVTNPPYSGHHMERLLSFAAQNKKPFLLLLPHFVYTKDYYKRGLGNDVSTKMFYIVPRGRYSYTPPSWVSSENGGSAALAKGKTETAPFPSFWYCRIPAASSAWLAKTFGPSGKFDACQKLHYASCTAHIPREAKGEFDTTKKRPNPRARKRAFAKKKKVV